MRAFVSVDLPLPDSLVPPDSPAPPHATIAFLGEVADDRTDDLVASLRRALVGERAFPVQVAGVGAFPSPERPRIVFAQVGEGDTALRALAGKVRLALEAARFRFDRKPFVPHVTILRIRNAADLDRARSLLDAPPPPGPRGRLAALDLKASELTQRGAIHRVVARLPLADG